MINSGGVLHGTGLELLGWDQARLDEALRGLGETLKELYADDGRSPVHAAEALVARGAAARPLEQPAHGGLVDAALAQPGGHRPAALEDREQDAGVGAEVAEVADEARPELRRRRRRRRAAPA